MMWQPAIIPPVGAVHLCCWHRTQNLQEKRFPAKSSPSAMNASGTRSHLETSTTQPKCEYLNKHLKKNKNKILLQKSLPNSSRAWLLVRRPLSCLNSVSGVCYSCAGQMGQLISGQLRRWDFDFQTTYWLSSSPSMCVWKKICMQQTTQRECRTWTCSSRLLAVKCPGFARV